MVRSKLKIIKILIVLILLIIGFQSLTNADNIRDFEIEGVSIGDSLLDYFTKDQIDNNDLKANFKDKTVEGILFQDIDLIVNYDAMQFVYKIKNMEIINITALIQTGEDIELCKKKKDQIVKDLNDIFINTEKINDQRNHSADITGKSKVTSTFFNFKNGDYVAVECEQWSKEMGHPNSLKVSLRTNFYNKFLIKEYE